MVFQILNENDIDLIGKIEGLIEKNIEKIEYKETEVLSLMQKVFRAKNVAQSKMMDDGFDEKAKEWKKQKLKMLPEKGLLKETSKKRKRKKEFVEKGKNRKKWY